MEFGILILVLFFVTNSFDKAESVQLEELPLQTFEELFVEEWWDKDEAEDFTTDQNPPLTKSDHSGQIKPNSTDQSPPLTESDHSGQIKPNSTDQSPPLTKSDHSGQIKPNQQIRVLLSQSLITLDKNPNSTDQNPPLTKSDHSDNAKNAEEQNEIMKEITSNNKCKIIDKFHAIKEEFKQKGKYSKNKWVQIENRIAKHLKINRTKIFKWKKEFGLSQIFYEKEERKHLVEKFDQMKAELKRGGFKNSYKNEIDETIAKDLGLSLRTISNWKRKLGQTKPKHNHSQSEQKELMKHYYEIKDKKPKISDADIAKMFKIVRSTLCNWKRQFKRQNVQETEA